MESDIARLANIVSIDDIREKIRYCPETGAVIWISGNKLGARWGRIDAYGYISGIICRTYMKGHRLAWLLYYGQNPPRDMVVDHINGVRNDNRISNLRLASVAQNRGNTGVQKRNISGQRGVSWYNKTKKWRAQINDRNGGMRHIGYFECIAEAKNAYDAIASERYGEFYYNKAVRE